MLTASGLARTGRVAAALAVALLTTAGATLPQDVAEAVQRSLDAMDDGSRPPVTPASLASQVSVSPSGDDWVIDYEKTDDFGWCGTGGCTHELWVAREGGHVLVFSEAVLDWRITPGAPAILDIDIHGANCDAIGSEPCLRRFVWNEATGRLEEAVNREGVGYLVGPLFQPIEPEPDPAAVQTEIDRREAVCRAAGGLIDRGDYPAVSSPDLNGDGRRDWIIGSRYIGCHSAKGDAAPMPAMGVTVIASIDDGWRAVLTVEQTAYVVELREGGPARFGLRDEVLCQTRPGCPTRFFTWNAAAGALEDQGDVAWSPVIVPTAETWLECEVALTREIASSGAGRQDMTASLRGLLEDVKARYAQASPPLSAADDADRRVVFADRYGDRSELDQARWRVDRCVTLL